jgi:tryptophan synthase alpha chain
MLERASGRAANLELLRGQRFGLDACGHNTSLDRGRIDNAHVHLLEQVSKRMTRLTSAFAAAAAQHRAALVTFVTAGDGDTAAILDAIVAGGADVIELGMPFTDPMADGPAIQAANLRSLAKGTRTADVLAIAAAFRQRHPDVPLVLMGYANTMTRPTPDVFAQMAADAGVDGAIIVDIPPEEADEIAPFADHAIATIRLATPTTDAARLPAVLSGASGFLYYVSVAGITGLQQAAQDSIEAAVAKLKAATDLPVAVGFGVRTPEQAAAIGRVADGVVVGSAIIDLIAANGADAPAAVRTYIQSLSAALAEARKEPA